MGIHKMTTLTLSALLATLGCAIVVITVAKGGGVFARGVVIGAVFFLAGSLRFWLVITSKTKGSK